jgi:hypothetical protein
MAGTAARALTEENPMTTHTQNEPSSTVRNADDIRISTRTLEFAV